MRLLALLLLASVANAGTATLTWTAPTQNTDGSPITGALTYNCADVVESVEEQMVPRHAGHCDLCASLARLKALQT